MKTLDLTMEQLDALEAPGVDETTAGVICGVLFGVGVVGAFLILT